MVRGAVFADRLIVENLTDFSLVPRSGASGRSPLDDAGYRIARLLRAPAQGQHTYTPRPPAFIGRHFTTYRDAEDQEVTLTYKRRLVQYLSMNAIFVAEAKAADDIEPAQVVVKFAYKYNREAHLLLQAAEHAPRLRHCEFEPSVGLWVVLMDYVADEVTLDKDERLTQPSHTDSLRAAVR
ncbi:hypothetical protein C8Q80DRAFT_1275278 [Daedaleopsis nitida]|nr:hypothetical protein C8Q80DRAFT_1275278 [Daedaleopsis nitida]